MPFPVVLVLVGTVLGLVPGLPRVGLDPQIVFMLFLPPLLYAGAFLTSWPEFAANARPISLLSVGLVLFTVGLVGLVGHFGLGLPWAVAFTLGAIVAPTDAVAALAVTKGLNVPRRVIVVLEGENLVNDASGLVAYRFAVAAVVANAFDPAQAVLAFVGTSVGGLAFGWVVGWAAVRLHLWLNRQGVDHAPVVTTVTLLTPFAAYLPAEHLGASGVLAVVAAGGYVGSRCRRLFTPEMYRENQSVWGVVDFVLNSLAFILIGCQLPLILEGIEGHTLSGLAWAAVSVSAAVVLGRVLWVFPATYLPRFFSLKLRARDPYPHWSIVMVIAWSGMRGVVSLAAAMAVPMTTADGSPFPGRSLLLFITFAVIFVTLVGQGLTLPWVVRGVRIADGPAAEPDEIPAACDADPAPIRS